MGQSPKLNCLNSSGTGTTVDRGGIDSRTKHFSSSKSMTRRGARDKPDGSNSSGTIVISTTGLTFRLLFADNVRGGVARHGSHPPTETGIRLHLRVCGQTRLFA